MKFIRYTGPYRSVTSLNIEFPRNEYVAVPPRVAEQLLKSREFEAKPADSGEQLIEIKPATPVAPAAPAPAAELVRNRR